MDVCLLSAVFSTYLLLCINTVCPENMSGKKLLSIEYEIFGRVQGVFFRKFTQQESKKLGLRGWCMNTENGTVQGLMEGEESKVNQMMEWLQHTGSPKSVINKAVFKNQKLISDYSFSNFSIKR